ncbi:MAG TPA: SHOCT domain-containing protein [Candidatus Limnocylindrales bacterium]
MVAVPLVGWIELLAIVALPVAIGMSIVALGRRLAHAGRDDSSRLLRERFARGEITRAEYEEARRILAS